MFAIRVFLFIFLGGWGAWAERQSIWIVSLNQKDAESITIFPNYMYEDSYVTVLLICDSNLRENVEIEITWYLQQLNCMDEMYNAQAKAEKQLLDSLYLETSTANTTCPDGWQEMRYSVFQTSTTQHVCGESKIISPLADEAYKPRKVSHVFHAKHNMNATEKMCVETVTTQKNITDVREVSNRVAAAWEDGMYQFLLQVKPLRANANFTMKGRIEIRSASGYLSAIQWPLLPLSGVMSILYLTAGTGWVFIWAYSHQHSHKIHVVIGVVAVAGAMANTFSFVDYSTINTNGVGYPGIQWISRLIDAFQGTVTVLVLMIVSTGYGITRPKLSRNIMNSALVISVIHYISMMGVSITTDETLRLKYKYPGVDIAAFVLFGVSLFIEGIWIVVFSILTFVHLFKRQHSQKLKIFCIFMATCIVSFIALLVVLPFSYGFFVLCRTDWKNEWLLKSFPSMEHLVLLVVLMWLWRPADEAQSYAFSPIGVDDYDEGSGEEDDEEDVVVYHKEENGKPDVVELGSPK